MAGPERELREMVPCDMAFLANNSPEKVMQGGCGEKLTEQGGERALYFPLFLQEMHRQWGKFFFCNFFVAIASQVVHISIRQRHGAPL